MPELGYRNRRDFKLIAWTGQHPILQVEGSFLTLITTSAPSSRSTPQSFAAPL